MDSGRDPSLAHGPGAVKWVVAICLLFPAVHYTPIQSPNDVLSTQGEGILCLSFAIRRVTCYSGSHPLPPSISKHHYKVKFFFSNTVFPTAPLIRQTAVVEMGSQLSFHVNKDRRRALSGFVRVYWKMLVSGLDWSFGNECQLASTTQRHPESPAPATTADLEKRGVGGGT